MSGEEIIETLMVIEGLIDDQPTIAKQKLNYLIDDIYMFKQLTMKKQDKYMFAYFSMLGLIFLIGTLALVNSCG